MPYQLTIHKPVETRGVGLHTAVRCHLRLLPAPADTGIVFRRVDLDNFEIEAHVRNVARVSYATSLMKQGVLLSTVEHLLAALYSCGVDNVYVELDALELPILDGSSKPFIELLAQAEIRKLRRQRRYIHVIKPLEFSDGDRRIGIYPADEFRVHCFVDYKHPNVGPQEVEMTADRQSFSRELAPARTFGFMKDFAGLQAMGLIGGLALVGRPLKARIVAHKAGHALHTQLVTRLLADHTLWTETTASQDSGDARPSLADSLPATS